MSQTQTKVWTFLFTDIEGSTKLWEAHPEAMRPLLARHDAILRKVIEENRGRVVKQVGDSFHAVFSRPADAVKAVVAAQSSLLKENWSDVGPIKVRMAVHTGEADERDGDYFGAALNRCSRMLTAGHGGQTLLSTATHELLRDSVPPGVTLKDLGEHRLKDLIRQEHIYQVCHPDLPAEFPPLRSLASFTHNLPVQMTSFVGREKEINEIKDLLKVTRLFTLAGSGGVGKTRLSLQVGAELLDKYPDGVWQVELAALSDPSLVPQAVAAALGLREEPRRTLTDTLADALRSKKSLLIFDNCEHLVEACARLADALLKVGPNLRIIATSREGLRLVGEVVWRVPSLSVPDPLKGPAAESLTQYESVRLFVDRGAAVKPGFRVTPQNGPAVAQICWRLDGIPLAIELAAARVNVLSPEQISDRLNDRFRLLTGGSRTALPRHQTLQAAVEWSYDLLSEKEKKLFDRLSVFSGGFTMEAAEEVCSGDGVEKSEVLDLLTHLTEKSLVVAEEE